MVTLGDPTWVKAKSTCCICILYDVNWQSLILLLQSKTTLLWSCPMWLLSCWNWWPTFKRLTETSYSQLWSCCQTRSSSSSDCSVRSSQLKMDQLRLPSVLQASLMCLLMRIKAFLRSNLSTGVCSNKYNCSRLVEWLRIRNRRWSHGWTRCPLKKAIEIKTSECHKSLKANQKMFTKQNNRTKRPSCWMERYPAI